MLYYYQKAILLFIFPTYDHIPFLVIPHLQYSFSSPFFLPTTWRTTGQKSNKIYVVPYKRFNVLLDGNGAYLAHRRRSSVSWLCTNLSSIISGSTTSSYPTTTPPQQHEQTNQFWSWTFWTSSKTYDIHSIPPRGKEKSNRLTTTSALRSALVIGVRWTAVVGGWWCECSPFPSTPNHP